MARLKSARRRAIRTKLTLDHIILRVYGGTNVQENLQLLCPSCHVEKSKKEIRHRHPAANRKAGEKLRRWLEAQQKAPTAETGGAS
jgi:5-methylcytosine-specific restriction endonuclease McrA